MESFIYQDLNNATRAKDESKIKYYGAFSAALSYIIYSANKNRVRHKLQGTTVLYRGLNLDREAVDLYSIGSKKHLMGYTSTSDKL